MEPVGRIEVLAGSPELTEALRIAEALVFASNVPVTAEALMSRLPEGVDIAQVMARLMQLYAGRGIHLMRVGGGWVFRTAPDLAARLAPDHPAPKRLPRAATEVLAIVAYHQPVTRAEIEDVRGVATSRGTLDLLLEAGWIRMRGRRRTPGRPVTYGTTPEFLAQFGLDSIADLPGLDELKGAGILDAPTPRGFSVPSPNDVATLRDDEDALEEAEEPLDPGDEPPRAP